MIFVLGGNGFVGNGYVQQFQHDQLDYEIITRENYDAFKGRHCDVLINANGNSRKYLAENDPVFDFAESVASVHRSLNDFSFDTYVYLSSGDVYPDASGPAKSAEDSLIEVDSQSNYGFHKLLSEQIVRHFASKWLIIRQGGFVGEGLKKNAVFDILQGQPLRVSGASRFQFIDTQASARAVLDLLAQDHCNQVFNLTGAGTISVDEICSMAGVAVDILPGSPEVCYDMSLEKVSSYIQLPETRDTIARFLAVCGAKGAST